MSTTNIFNNISNHLITSDGFYSVSARQLLNGLLMHYSNKGHSLTESKNYILTHNITTFVKEV